MTTSHYKSAFIAGSTSKKPGSKAAVLAIYTSVTLNSASRTCCVKKEGYTKRLYLVTDAKPSNDRLVYMLNQLFIASPSTKIYGSKRFQTILLKFAAFLQSVDQASERIAVDVY